MYFSSLGTCCLLNDLLGSWEVFHRSNPYALFLCHMTMIISSLPTLPYQNAINTIYNLRILHPELIFKLVEVSYT